MSDYLKGFIAGVLLTMMISLLVIKVVILDNSILIPKDESKNLQHISTEINH